MYVHQRRVIDCLDVGTGIAIPIRMDRISKITIEPKFFRVVEKYTVFMKLVDAKFYEDIPCIIITGKGQPDSASR